MSKHNYSQYSKKNNYNKPAVEDTTENIVIPEVNYTFVELHDVKMEPVNETVDTVTLPKTVTGTVFNCAKLNVRSKPDTDAEVLTILDTNAEVVIDPARSINDWLKITTAAGVEGFCMRKYVSAKL